MDKNSQINKLSNKIIDNNYKNSKNKNPFTQAAEKAKELLSHTYNPNTGKMDNFDGESLPANEAVKVNEFWNKNFQDQKKDDYFKKLKTYGIEESSKKEPGYPKLQDVPIINRNINKIAKTNATVQRYKDFKEEKKFNLEYGDKAIEQHIRKKEYENKKAGRAPHAGFSTSDQVVAIHAQDKAKKQLDAIKASSKLKIEPDYLSYREATPIKPMPSLEEYMATRAPKEAAGITGLSNVQHMKGAVNHSNRAFNLKNSKGIGPFLTGEDD